VNQSFTFQDVLSSFEVGILATTVYLTVISGYLAVAYVVGAKLTRSQLVLISTLFVSFAALFAWGSFGFFNTGFRISSDFSELGFAETYMPILVLLSEFIGIIAALRFMYDIRKNADS